MLIAGTPALTAGLALRPRIFSSNRPLLVALDVEWTKNYRVRGANLPFCYSLCLVELPPSGSPLGRVAERVGLRSVYCETVAELVDLARLLEEDLASVFAIAPTVVGHQLCSDLAVMRNSVAELADSPTLPLLDKMRDAWHLRKTGTGPIPVFDTRFDMVRLPATLSSRRLVDICEALGLCVTQPELRRRSMTALHQEFLHTGDKDIYQRVAVLNMRHSLSTALVAAVELGETRLEPVDINRVLRDHLWDSLSYVSSAEFSALIDI